MKVFEVRCTIDAPPERVWARLTDAQALVNGGLGVLRLEGTIAAGERLKVWSEASPDRAFALTVTEFTPHRRMFWTGGMPLGLFKGVRTFTLVQQGNGTTEFILQETFSGPLLALFGGTIPDMTEPFKGFVAGLKKRAEGTS